MLAAIAAHPCPEDPLSALRLVERPDPEPPEGWTRVRVRAAAVNHHDLWILKGVGLAPERYPVVLGVEAAGVDEDGNDVVVYPVVADAAAGRGDPTLDPRMGMLSQEYDGTFAEFVTVPAQNVVPLPPSIPVEEASCLAGAWLTAYRMLFENAGLDPGSTVLVQGVGGGVATAAIQLASAAGHRVWATSRSGARREWARSLGVDDAFEPGARLPERVDAVIETVGAATFDHSLRSVRPGGRVVVAGATTGTMPPVDLARLFYRQISIVGSTLGTRDQLSALLRFCEREKVLPVVDRVLSLRETRSALASVELGDMLGKIVVRP
ncbi:zinc-binding dehydrogenase [Nocardiopsis quinghaiensis]|uniref:zinc-binding dehydrogenase n=1 Tax=Nocardiopsis quinghaiensis TaxID=464995 RepID=UPI001238CF93|nr:zinc-binding dehydrogenase [Nocardiopsis quinghaiensis]